MLRCAYLRVNTTIVMRYDRKTHLGKDILVDPLCALSLVDMDLVVVGRNGNVYFKSVCV